MFVDIVGSTEIASKLDPEEWRDLLADYQQAISMAVGQYGGRIAQFIGDGVVAYFGWPNAQENDGERGILSGAAALENIAVLNSDGKPADRPEYSVRIGLHAGLVVLDETGEVYGEAPNIAARVQAAARPNSIFITEALKQIVSARFELTKEGSHDLKGVEAPLKLYSYSQVSALSRQPGTANYQTTSEFVNRSDELAVLTNCWAQVCKGRGQVVTIEGEPGIGKSRLVREFQRRLGTERHNWFEFNGDQFAHATAFFPILNSISTTFAQQSDLSPVQQASLVEKWLRYGRLNLPEAVPLILELLELPLPETYHPLMLEAGEKRRRLLQTFVAWAIGSTRERPTVLLLEDMQWIDPSTIELAQLIAEDINAHPLFLIQTSRPDVHRFKSVQQHQNYIALTKLGDDEVRNIITSLSEDTRLADGLIDKLVERVDGVPLFAEELTRFSIQRDGSLATREIPTNITELLMSRLDRIGPAKLTAQIGSVLGREFSRDLVVAISGSPRAEIDQWLQVLTDAGLIHETGLSLPTTYAFNHALTQDVAYEALLKSQRLALHARAADAIAEQHPELIRSHPEVIARHRSEGGQPQLALVAWRSAASVALSRGAYSEAEELYQRAMADLLALAETAKRDIDELALLNNLIAVLQITRGYSAAQTIDATRKAKNLVEKGGNISKVFVQIARTWAATSSAGDHREAARIAENLFDLVRREGSGESVAHAYMIKMTSRNRVGDFRAAEQAFEEGFEHFKTPSFRRRRGAIAQTFGNGAYNAWILGRIGVSRSRIATALQVAEDNENNYDRAFAKFMAATYYLQLGDADQAAKFAQDSMNISDDDGFPQFAATSRIALGRAQMSIAPSNRAIGYITDGIAGMNEAKSRVGLTLYLAWLAEAHMIGGNLQEMELALKHAMAVNSEELFCRPEVLRLRGELCARKQDEGQAKQNFQNAITMAESMGANIYQLRAVLAMSRHYRTSDDAAFIRDLLDPVYRKIKDGGDSPDFREARSLLNEMNR